MDRIGVIGGGQLGRMFALNAKRMGYEVIALDPQPHSPCGQVCDDQIVAPYDDTLAIEQLGRRTDIVTYEFENIAIGSIEYLERNGFRVTPGSDVLRVTQDRLLEKSFVRDCGIPVAEFAPIRSTRDIAAACAAVGFPAIVKTARGGYDGKGQWRVENANEVEAAVAAAKGAPLIIERFVPFEREISVICTRDATGAIVTYPVAENEHDSGILAMSIAPARVSPSVSARARDIGAIIAERLKIVGTFCVEFFATPDGEVLVNEIAPRPHNSGHYSIDATQCSQYEQHVRAICGLPLSPPRLLQNAIMMNILGTGTGNHLAGTETVLSDPDIVLHMYGKKHAVNRRKMGHFTLLVDGPINDAAINRAREAHAALHWV
jgi:5-(carboxyamino)imidazole ribonucleotide synthase